MHIPCRVSIRHLTEFSSLVNYVASPLSKTLPTPTMNPEETSIPSRRTFIKTSAYSAVATSFAFSSASILTSCQSVRVRIITPYGEAEVEVHGSSAPSGTAPLLINSSAPGGPTATNTADYPVTVTGPDGTTITIAPGETVPVQPA